VKGPEKEVNERDGMEECSLEQQDLSKQDKKSIDLNREG